MPVLYWGSTGKTKMIKQNVHSELSGALKPPKEFQKWTGHEYKDSEKRVPRMRIFKKVRIASGGFWKMSDLAAEDFPKNGL
jgi:hypothetical protein